MRQFKGYGRTDIDLALQDSVQFAGGNISRPGSTDTVRPSVTDEQNREPGNDSTASPDSQTQESPVASYLGEDHKRFVPVSIYNNTFRLYVPEDCDNFGKPTCDGIFDQKGGSVSFMDPPGTLQVRSMKSARLFGRPNRNSCSPTVIVGDVTETKTNEKGKLESCTGKWGAVTRPLPLQSHQSVGGV
jgi:hypothetical protein